jgi:hypothetical protein
MDLHDLIKESNEETVIECAGDDLKSRRRAGAKAFLW